MKDRYFVDSDNSLVIRKPTNEEIYNNDITSDFLLPKESYEVNFEDLSVEVINKNQKVVQQHYPLCIDFHHLGRKVKNNKKYIEEAFQTMTSLLVERINRTPTFNLKILHGFNLITLIKKIKGEKFKSHDVINGPCGCIVTLTTWFSFKQCEMYIVTYDGNPACVNWYDNVVTLNNEMSYLRRDLYVLKTMEQSKIVKELIKRTEANMVNLYNRYLIHMITNRIRFFANFLDARRFIMTRGSNIINHQYA